MRRERQDRTRPPGRPASSPNPNPNLSSCRSRQRPLRRRARRKPAQHPLGSATSLFGKAQGSDSPQRTWPVPACSALVLLIGAAPGPAHQAVEPAVVAGGRAGTSGPHQRAPCRVPAVPEGASTINGCGPGVRCRRGARAALWMASGPPRPRRQYSPPVAPLRCRGRAGFFSGEGNHAAQVGDPIWRVTSCGSNGRSPRRARCGSTGRACRPPRAALPGARRGCVPRADR